MTRVGLIGCGRIGQMHAAIVNKAPNASLAGVFDLNGELARSTAVEYKTEFFETEDQLFSSKLVDVVFISSSTSTHASFIEKAIRSQKGVFCEKPIDVDISRISECYHNVKDTTLPIQIGFNRRFDPGHAAVKLDFEEGKIGKIHQMIITSRDPEMPTREYYRSAGGLFRDMTIHDFDLARFFLNEDPVEIFVSAQRLIDPKYMSEIADHDTAMVILCFSDGTQCLINNSRSAVYGYDQRVELLGSKGMLQSDNIKLNNTKYYHSSGTEISQPYLHFFTERYKAAFSAQFDSFISAVEKGQPPKVGLEDGYKAAIIAEAAYESVREQRPVFIKYDL